MKDYRGDFLHIGEFELTASRLRVSDPCYSPDVWCSGVLDAKPGTWEAAVLQFTNEQTGGWGVRNAMCYWLISIREGLLDNDAVADEMSQAGFNETKWSINISVLIKPIEPVACGVCRLCGANRGTLSA